MLHRRRASLLVVTAGLQISLAALFDPASFDSARFSQGYDGSSCPGRCFGAGVANPPHGYCNASTGDRMSMCECQDLWSGGAWDCSERACPAGKPWFSLPTSATEAHAGTKTCSNRGSCDYYSSGRCACADDFEGHACQRLRCPGWNATTSAPCSGHGRCVTMREAGRLRPISAASSASLTSYSAMGGRSAGFGGNPVDYSGWDADMVSGCLCDDGWSGFDCSLRECPMGSDPHVRGALEVQLFRAQVTNVREVQTITISGSDSAPFASADVDEVQTLTLEGFLAPPTGSFYLAFDSRGLDGKCKLCIVAATATTASVSLSGTPATDAAALQVALEALSNVGTGGVSVSGATTALGYAFAITFVGANVGGDVSLLSLDASGLAGTADATSAVVETTAGSEATGTVTLSFDESGSYPTAADLAVGGDTADAAALAAAGTQTSTALAVGASASSVAAAVTSIVFASAESPPGGAIVVSREGTGGPGVRWVVTFASGVRARGNVAQVAIAGSALSIVHASLAAPAASAAAATRTQGTFLGGSFTMRLSYTAEDSNAQTTHATPALDWNAPAATVAAALNALDDTVLGSRETGGYGLGVVTVSRARSAAVLSTYAWAGEYEWRVTFTSASENVPLAPLPSAVDLTDGSGIASISSGRGAAIVVSTGVEGGSGTAEVNEVQLIDCRCSSCSDPTKHTVRLAFTPHAHGPGRHGSAIVPSFAAQSGAASGGGGAVLPPGGRLLALLPSGVELRRDKWGRTVEITAPIPYSATAAQLRAALAALPSIPDVQVRLYDAGSSTATASVMCDADGVTAAITFTHNAGPQAQLSVHSPAADFALPAYGAGMGGAGGTTSTIFAIRTAYSAQGTGSLSPGGSASAPDASLLVRGLFGGRARAGSRVLLPCSGRGSCDGSTGKCTCYALRNAGDTATVGSYGASNGAGGELAAAPADTAGGSLDCGYPSVTPQNCPATAAGGICSGHGTCAGSPTWRCSCTAGYTGAACEFEACPSTFSSSVSATTPTRTWFDTPSSATDAHAAGAVCSGRGVCGTAGIFVGPSAGGRVGACQCEGGFRGEACQYSSCPPGGRAAGSPAEAVKDTCASEHQCSSLRDFGLWHRWAADGTWLSPAVPANRVDYKDSWEALQLRGCACNLTRAYVGGGRGSTTPSFYVPVNPPYNSYSPSSSASSNVNVRGSVKGGGTGGGSLTLPRGWDCREYDCPRSDDPLNLTAVALYSANTDVATAAHPYEVQTVTCYAGSGHVWVSFRNSTSRGFPSQTYVRNDEAPFANVTGAAYTFERALGELANVTGQLTITSATPGSLLCSASGITTRVTFTNLNGPLPLLKFDGDTTARTWPAGPSGSAGNIPVIVERVQPASIGPHECSRRGACVRDKGLCSCMPQFLSSDGKFGPGNRGDCGHSDVLQSFNRDLASAEMRVQDFPDRKVFGL